MLDICRTVTKKEPTVSYFPGYTDTAVIAGKLQNHNCMSYGPGNLECAHQPDEWVTVFPFYLFSQKSSVILKENKITLLLSLLKNDIIRQPRSDISLKTSLPFPNN